MLVAESLAAPFEDADAVEPAEAEYNPEPNGADRFFFCFLRFCFFCWEGVRSLCVAASLPTMMLSFVVRFKQPVEIQTPNFLSTKSIGWYARASGDW